MLSIFSWIGAAFVGFILLIILFKVAKFILKFIFGLIGLGVLIFLVAFALGIV
ncbi:hypothetical protein V2E24_03230 [Mycoplasmopsis ciconiae]|uniref:Uncharacterized protein n=1 Tax=Mycoplasmopsis ciconiae TaxID=561067 RepID=A0ABU7MM43_9BACT|nr:hypothetical protein [Mycoplasmopsis ciconiae]